MEALTPEQLATARREANLVRARAEKWPKSDVVDQMMGSPPATDGRRRTHDMRAGGELLGIWSDAEQTFYYPLFQFLPDGCVHPKWPLLLTALCAIPTLSPMEDPTGWGRFGWLTQLRGALSERDLAESASMDGVAPNEAQLSRKPRTPAEVFNVDPDAVIDLARTDARTLRDHH
jgi:hypothetical protein